MPTPTEHKTVQAHILTYAEAIGWTFVSRKEAEHRRGFDPDAPPKDRAKNRSLFFDDLLDAKVREFNPRYTEAGGALLRQFRHFHTDIYGNQKFVEYLHIDGHTVWLTQLEIAELFQTTKQNINLHTKHIFKEGELAENATVKDSLTVQIEGKREARRTIQHYNFDLIPLEASESIAA